jgi:N-acetylglucosaminyldiphosphoundecaprenol N-acetyl-beta-D-mannosaminyltransferase
MIDRGKKNVLGIAVDAVDYDAAVARILAAARDRRRLSATALAVHGVMTGLRSAQRSYVNHLDMVTPDGQPVRWALNLLYRAGLRSTVCGTTLTERVVEEAATSRLPVYFYGSSAQVLRKLDSALRQRYPDLVIAGLEASRFRPITLAEVDEIAARIVDSAAAVVFIGLGCPRQEVFAYELGRRLERPIVAVGAAFDYLAGELRLPPARLSRMGLEWLWRLGLEPRRLWRRYVLLNPIYVVLLVCQALRLWRPSADARLPVEPSRIAA